MPTAFDPTGDFSAILDGGETLTLLRRGSSNPTAIATAWRRVERHSESQPSGGYALQANVHWQFEWPAGTRLPQPGDRLRDATGECFTILIVSRRQANTRLQCETRNLRIAHGLDCLVDVELAVWEDLGTGPEIIGWTTFRPAVHARIQPDEVTVDETADPVTSTAKYQVVLEDSTPLDHNHRIVSGEGTVYRVLSYTGAERIDQLPVAVVRRE